MWVWSRWPFFLAEAIFLDETFFFKLLISDSSLLTTSWCACFNSVTISCCCFDWASSVAWLIQLGNYSWFMNYWVCWCWSELCNSFFSESGRAETYEHCSVANLWFKSLSYYWRLSIARACSSFRVSMRDSCSCFTEARTWMFSCFSFSISTLGLQFCKSLLRCCCDSSICTLFVAAIIAYSVAAWDCSISKSSILFVNSLICISSFLACS